MARANLASLLAESTDRPAVQEASPTPGVAGRTVEESGPRDAAVGRASLPPAGLRPDSDGGFDTGQQSSAPGPRYLQFERKSCGSASTRPTSWRDSLVGSTGPAAERESGSLTTH